MSVEAVNFESDYELKEFQEPEIGSDGQRTYTVLASGEICNNCLNNPNILHEVSVLSVPIISLVGAATIQGAKADAYTECIDACDRNGRDASPLAIFVCYALCWAFNG